jgi:hypothetical protein
MNIPLSQRTAEDIYLEYVNDWLSIDHMAEYYGIEPEKLGSLIALIMYVKDEE